MMKKNRFVDRRWLFTWGVLIVLLCAVGVSGTVTFDDSGGRGDQSILEFSWADGWINCVNITGDGSALTGVASGGNIFDQDLNSTDSFDGVDITSTGNFIGDGTLITNVFHGNYFNQELNTSDSPTFVDGTFTGDIGVSGVITGDGGGLTNLSGVISGSPSLAVIRNSNNNSWTASEANFKTAMADLGVGGGNVWLPDGNLTVSSGEIEIPDNVHVIGAGIGATVLYLTQSSAIDGIFKQWGEHNWSLSYLTIDGNSADTRSRVINIQSCNDFHIHDIHIINPSLNGIYMYATNPYCERGMITNIWIQNITTAQGITGTARHMILDNINIFESDNTFEAIDVLFIDSSINNVNIWDADTGIKLPSESYNNVWSNINIRLREDSTKHGINCQGGTYQTFTGLFIDGGSGYAVYFNVDGSKIPHHITISNFGFTNQSGTTAVVYMPPVHAHNITFDNGYIEDFYYGRGIYIYTGRDITIKNVRIIEGYDDGGNSECIKLWQCNNITIEGCTLSGRPQGIYISDSHFIKILGNTITLNIDGILVTSTICSYIIISDNFVTHNTDKGIEFTNIAHNIIAITGNILTDNANDNLMGDACTNHNVTANVGTWT